MAVTLGIVPDARDYVGEDIWIVVHQYHRAGPRPMGVDVTAHVDKAGALSASSSLALGDMSDTVSVVIKPVSLLDRGQGCQC